MNCDHRLTFIVAVIFADCKNCARCIYQTIEYKIYYVKKRERKGTKYKSNLSLNYNRIFVAPLQQITKNYRKTYDIIRGDFEKLYPGGMPNESA